jgi:hypothetical protein
MWKKFAKQGLKLKVPTNWLIMDVVRDLKPCFNSQ